MSKRFNSVGPTRKIKDLGGGQKLVTPYGKDGSGNDYSTTKMGGGVNNLSDTLPKDGKVNP